MKHLVLLLVISTATLVVCQDSTTVKVPIDLLLPDLQAFEKYFFKVPAGVVGFVRWPQEITFTIRNTGSYLSVSGHFHDEPRIVENQFYFKDGMFYNAVGTEFFELDSSLDLFVNGQSEDSVGMATEQGINRHLFISYYSLGEIRQMIRPFHRANKDHADYYFTELPTMFLATNLDRFPYLLEYTTWTQYQNLLEAHGGLRVLIGEAREVAEGKTLRSVEASQLVYDPESKTVNIPAETDNPYDLLLNVFAVRMANTGFLADKLINHEARMLNGNDLRSGRLPRKTHNIPVVKLLEKVQIVEPRYTYTGNVHVQVRPDNVQFQLWGHIMVKKMNFRDNRKTELNEDCPLIVDINVKGGQFKYNHLPFPTICTDDSNLWITGLYTEKTYIQTGTIISLLYPD